MKKDVLLRFMQEQQQKLQPVVSNEGFKNGAPPAGTNYRIPSDTLYNPTPHRIKAVSDNGLQAELQPFDETQVHFPGAEYVDEYEMRMGGLKKFLPKAQKGLQTGIPADAERYGVNAAYDANRQFANQADVDAYRDTQGAINRGGARADYEQRIWEEIIRQQELAQKDPDGTFNVKEHADFLPQWVLDNPDSFYCISGACYTVNQAGEPLRFFDNSTAQNQIIAGNVPNWKVNYDTSTPQGGDIMQFLREDINTTDRLNDNKVHLGGPHHAGVVVPGSMVKNPDGTISLDTYMNYGSGDMELNNVYTYNPKTDLQVFRGDDGKPVRDDKGEFATHMGYLHKDGEFSKKVYGDRQSLIDMGVDPGGIFQAEGIQFLTRDFSKEDADKVKKRNLKRQKIEQEDPQFFKKGQERRWATYAPGLITFTGDDHTYMDGQDLGRGNQYLGSLSEEANRLLTRNTDKFDYNLDELSKSAGFKDILSMVNDPQWKQDFMKKYNISNREFNAVVLNTFGIYGQETGFGTKKGGVKESDTARRAAAKVQNVWNALRDITTTSDQGSREVREVMADEDYSRGLTQVKFSNISKEDREKYGLTAKNIESDPKKAFIASMLVSTQNLPELRRLAQKGETAAMDESNYLDFLPYMYQMPNRLRRGDKKTIARAIDAGVSPEEALVKDPNAPDANNMYLKNVRTFSNLFQHSPLQQTLEIKKHGGPFSPLHKFLNY